MQNRLTCFLTLLLPVFASPARAADPTTLERLQYNHPGMVVDLGVGLWAWPLPMDFDGDGDLDLVVNCPDQPYNGVYFFENPAFKGEKFPLFRPARRISKGLQNVQVSLVAGRPRVLSPGQAYPGFLQSGLDKPVKLPLPANIHPNKVRQNVWRYIDFDGDGKLDLVIGVDDWTEYGWDDGYNDRGEWKRGPLHGYVYVARNEATNEAPKYAKPEKVRADGKPVDTFGWPTPNFADFDGDGDLDLVCGEFLDQFTYFANIGSATKPQYAAGVRLTHAGQPLAMDLQMIVPAAIDWDGDGDQDLVVGDEDGRVALVEHTGKVVAGVPQFLPPRYFQQQAEDVKCGALATPVGVDWDGDGDQDIVCGNTAGYIVFFENLSGPKVERPKWAEPQRLEADGKTLRIQAGSSGSIQGPCEAKWGYTTLSAADWDHDGLTDLIVNSIWGRVQLYRNLGPKNKPRLAAAQSVEVEWPGETPKPEWVWWQPQGKELVTQWRTTPIAMDFTGDGLTDLVMLDQEGYAALFRRERREGKLALLPGERVFRNEKETPLRLNAGQRGKSGRRKWTIADWDGDGQLDILLNGQNANLLRQVAAKNGHYDFRDEGPVATRKIEGHDTSPTMVDFNGDRVPDLLIGAEDGRLYYLRNPR
jgi:hypothetical protein